MHSLEMFNLSDIFLLSILRRELILLCNFLPCLQLGFALYFPTFRNQPLVSPKTADLEERVKA